MEWHIYCKFANEIIAEMEYIDIHSYEELLSHNEKKKYVLFYKNGSQTSDCVFKVLEQIEDGKVYRVDVAQVYDVHTAFNVTSVPTLIILEDGKLQNVVKGCQTAAFYDQLIHEKAIKYSSEDENKKQARVVVYSTPTCTYCNKLKAYFNKHGIKYTDINVATNQAAANEMVKKSGQRGVPQTEINGQIIVGFDTQKLSRLLHISTE